MGVSNWSAFGLFLLVSSTVASMPGGITDDERPIPEDLSILLASIQPGVTAAVEKATNGPVWSLVPLTYKSQVVAGVNYFVSYKLNDSDVYYHARIYRDLQNKMHLVKISGPKTEDDPILYFS